MRVRSPDSILTDVSAINWPGKPHREEEGFTSFCEKHRVRGDMASALLESMPMDRHFDYGGVSRLAAAHALVATELNRKGFQP